MIILRSRKQGHFEMPKEVLKTDSDSLVPLPQVTNFSCASFVCVGVKSVWFVQTYGVFEYT